MNFFKSYDEHTFKPEYYYFRNQPVEVIYYNEISYDDVYVTFRYKNGKKDGFVGTEEDFEKEFTPANIKDFYGFVPEQPRKNKIEYKPDTTNKPIKYKEPKSSGDVWDIWQFVNNHPKHILVSGITNNKIAYGMARNMQKKTRI